MKKYRIGVVTFFDANNYGALFQTFALQKFLANHNVSSCVVDYKWHPEEKFESIKGFLYYFKHKKYIQKKRESFKTFLCQCSFSKPYNKENVSELKEECERFIVGSDQVWNSRWNYNSDVFYLTFTEKRFSYAASFGTVGSIPNYRKKIIIDDLSSFNSISVREKSAREYLSSLNIKSQVNVDPVFLLTKEDWSNYCSDKSYGDFILVYSLENNKEMFDFAKDLGYRLGAKALIISDTTKNKVNGIETVKYADPITFLTLFKNAKAVVTNSFHGTAFSIIFEKPFFTFLQKYNGAPNDRLIDLLNDCNLTNRIVEKPFYDCSINYIKTKNYFSVERKKSLEYLLSIDSGKYDRHKSSSNVSFRQLYFYAKSKSLSDITSSRSGGIAYVLGRHILQNEGVVYGAILQSDFKVNITRIQQMEELEKTRNSKYVSSNVQDTFKECLYDLNNGKTVLYSALPCQIAGLKRFLKLEGVNTEKLITIDIVCHGTPKQLFFSEYIKYLEKKYKGPISNFNFRDKRYGWDTHFESFEANNKIHRSRKYTQLFYSNYSLKEGCYNCPFSNLDRKSDITLSDAWGYTKKDDLNYGASIVIVNTSNGLNAFKRIKDELFTETINRLEYLQPNIIAPSQKPDDYDVVLNKIKNKHFGYIYNIATKKIRKLEQKNKIKSKIVKSLRALKLR